MIIRCAEPKDAVRLDEFLTRLIRYEAKYDDNLNKECVITDNYISKIGLDGHKILLAEHEGNIGGYLYGFIYAVPGVWVKPAALMDALYVDAEYRRQGCATMLFNEFKRFAEENGASRIELKVFSDNKPALSLYESLSFRETTKYMMLDLN